MGRVKVAVLAAAGAQWALNVATYANPLGIFIGVLVATAAAATYFFGKTETGQRIVRGFSDAILRAYVWAQKLGFALKANLVDRIAWLITNAKKAAALLANLPGFGGVVGRAAQGALEGRATGGPVKANTPYLVGERGVPEVFTPRVSGSISPSIADYAEDYGMAGMDDLPAAPSSTTVQLVVDRQVLSEAVLKGFRAQIARQG